MGMVDDGDVISTLCQVDYSTSFFRFGTTSVVGWTPSRVTSHHSLVAIVSSFCYVLSIRQIRTLPSFNV